MRADLSKVITERPRVGRRIKQPKGYKKEMKISDDSPSSEKIRLKWKKNHTESKEFSEKLGPLRRYLHSKIGQHWNDVYSEIRQGIDVGNIVQKHILTHVYDFVKIDVYLAVDGNYYSNPHGYSLYSGDMYVDPNTGILCKVKETKKEKFKNSPDVITVDETTIYKKIDGIWYELTVEKIPFTITNSVTVIGKMSMYYNNHKEYKPVFDVAHKVSFNYGWEANKFYGKDVYATKKRQLNSKEIKNLAA